MARLELNFRSSSCSSHVCLHSSCSGGAVWHFQHPGEIPSGLSWREIYPNLFLSTKQRGKGKAPTEKSYYISSIDKEKGNSLEFREYAEILEARLNEVGYYKSNALEAALCIQLEYKIGEPYVQS